MGKQQIRVGRALAWGTAIATVALLAMPTNVLALTSVEGYAIGDQGYYWHTGAESWIFPHRIGNVDNRAMLQLDAAGLEGITGQSIINGNVVAPAPGTGQRNIPLISNPFVYNAEGAQLGTGAGAVVELIDNLNLGLWFSGYNPGHGSFVDRGVGRLGWNHSFASVNDLDAVDPYLFAGTNFQANRKIDLFLSYWIPELGIEAGLRFWWGSNRVFFTPDNSTGPIRIDADSDPTTGDTDPPFGVGQEQNLDVDRSLYRMTDLGFGIGAGFSGIEGLRADVGFDMNFLGVGWQPNGLNDYVDVAGMGVGINLRAHYELTNNWTVGGFFRFRNTSNRLSPERQRDGGALLAPFAIDDPDVAASLPTPAVGGAPTAAGAPVGDAESGANELAPVRGLQYRERQAELQLAALVNYRPAPWASLYTAFGFDRRSALERVELGESWFNERHGSLMALPFVHLGFMGRVSDWLDVSIGARKRWQNLTLTSRAFDGRIPNNNDYQGPVGTDEPQLGESQAATNANRREQQVRAGGDASDTALMLGARFHVGGFQVMANLNPTFLVNGPYFLSGNSTDNNPAGQAVGWLGWVSLIYDWDWDLDVESGSGSMRPSPHAAEPPPAAAPAPTFDEPAPSATDDF